MKNLFQLTHMHTNSTNPPTSRPLRLLARLSLAFAVSASLPAFGAVRRSTALAATPWAQHASVKLVTTELTAQQLATQIHFTVNLGLRNYAQLQAELAAGKQVSHAEMEVNYLPLASTYNAVKIWLGSEGFSIPADDPNHTRIAASGTVQRVGSVMNVDFEVVTKSDGSRVLEAVSDPILPSMFSASVLGVTGLQVQVKAPNIALWTHAVLAPDIVVSGSTYVVPSDVRAAYSAPSNLDGAGQTVAVISLAAPSASDLTAFFSADGGGATASNVTTINVDGGALSTQQTNYLVAADLEAEWIAGFAPGVKVRFYVIPNGANPTDAGTQILADAAANKITVVLADESLEGALVPAMNQLCAQLVAAGITVVAPSGTGGSSDSVTFYSSSLPTQPIYPASDPYVLAVGGTNLSLNLPALTYASESTYSADSGLYASGGGYSSVFPRPSWQTGNSVLNNATNRCVPDVAAVGMTIGVGTADPVPVFGYVNGSIYYSVSIEGTTVSSSIWAGIVAMVNQTRASKGTAPIGLITPYLYPLSGTSAFTDITTGSNGAYSAGPGYDLCTGLGSPNITNLVNALATVSTINLPTITTQPKDQTVYAGNFATFSVTASGTGTLSYQWYRNGKAVSGATSSSFSVSTSSADIGYNSTILVEVSDSVGSVTSTTAILTVNAQPSGGGGGSSGGGGGGGGGAPSDWFFAALAALVLARLSLRARHAEVGA